jgi:hypothetical protein
MAYKKKMKKQGQKDKEDEKLAMEVKGVKDKLKKGAKKKKGAGGWIAHVKAYAKKHGVSYKVAMTKAKASYKKK